MTERALLIVLVTALFLGLGVMGFVYQRHQHQSQAICASSQAQCLDHPYFSSP